MIHRIGYACINQTLSNEKISVNRGMIRRTFLERGLPYAGELIVQNLQDLLKIIQWNQAHNISFYRLSSDMMPWLSEYELEQLPQFEEIKALLRQAGQLARQFDQRLSFHPGPFNVLASEKEGVVEKTIRELDQHSHLMDLMGLEASPFNKINIHIGSSLQGEKVRAMENFCRSFSKLSPNTKARLTVENDDKASMFHIGDLYQGIYQTLNIPLVFDFHHHYCNTGGYTEEEALKMAASTWPAHIRPVVHYSEPKSLDDKKMLRAHSEFVEHEIPTYGLELDVMLEAKQKECALLQYRQQKKKGKLHTSLFNKLPSLQQL